MTLREALNYMDMLTVIKILNSEYTYFDNKEKMEAFINNINNTIKQLKAIPKNKRQEKIIILPQYYIYSKNILIMKPTALLINDKFNINELYHKKWCDFLDCKIDKSVFNRYNINQICAYALFQIMWFGFSQTEHDSNLNKEELFCDFFCFKNNNYILNDKFIDNANEKYNLHYIKEKNMYLINLHLNEGVRSGKN